MALVMSWMPAASTSLTCATDTAPLACDSNTAGKGWVSLARSSCEPRASSCAGPAPAAGGSCSSRAAGVPGATRTSRASASAPSVGRPGRAPPQALEAQAQHLRRGRLFAPLHAARLHQGAPLARLFRKIELAQHAAQVL